MAADITPEQLAPGFEFRPAWRRDDPEIARDAVDFWTRHALLPAKVSAEERVKELSAAAYKDGRLVGVTTVRIGRLDQVRARLGMLRGAVDPEFRRTRVGFALALCTRQLLEAWAKANPQERLGGLGAIVEAAELTDRAKEPYWPTTRFIVAGFMPDGRQIRVSWFDDFLLDP